MNLRLAAKKALKGQSLDVEATVGAVRFSPETTADTRALASHIRSFNLALELPLITFLWRSVGLFKYKLAYWHASS